MTSLERTSETEAPICNGSTESPAARREQAGAVPRRVDSAAISSSTLDLEGSIVVLLTMLANQLSVSGSLTFQRRHGLSSTEWKVMAVVAAMPGSSGADIAQVLSIDKAAVSRTVRALIDRGLFAEARKKGNLKAIRLTETGRALHAEALGTARERETCLLADLQPAECETLHNWLRMMIRRMPAVLHLAQQPMADALNRPQMPAAPEQPAGAEDELTLRDRVDRLESLLADVMLENAALRRQSV